jgi:hypothetical protein
VRMMFSGLECLPTIRGVFSGTVRARREPFTKLRVVFPSIFESRSQEGNRKSHIFLKIFTGFSGYFLGNYVVTPVKLPERRR